MREKASEDQTLNYADVEAGNIRVVFGKLREKRRNASEPECPSRADDRLRFRSEVRPRHVGLSAEDSPPAFCRADHVGKGSNAGGKARTGRRPVLTGRSDQFRALAKFAVAVTVRKQAHVRDSSRRLNVHRYDFVQRFRPAITRRVIHSTPEYFTIKQTDRRGTERY